MKTYINVNEPKPELDLESLPGDYVAGLVDGEGCFYLTYRSEIKYNRPGAPKYYRWTPYFAINLKADDVKILKKIKSALGCGNIYFSKDKYFASFNVQNIDELHNKVLPFFEKFRLRAKKRLDFELWKQALIILYGIKGKRIPLDPKLNSRLYELRNEMRKYKSYLARGYKNSPF